MLLQRLSTWPPSEGCCITWRGRFWNVPPWAGPSTPAAPIWEQEVPGSGQRRTGLGVRPGRGTGAAQESGAHLDATERRWQDCLQPAGLWHTCCACEATQAGPAPTTAKQPTASGLRARVEPRHGHQPLRCLSRGPSWGPRKNGHQQAQDLPGLACEAIKLQGQQPQRVTDREAMRPPLVPVCLSATRLAFSMHRASEASLTGPRPSEVMLVASWSEPRQDFTHWVLLSALRFEPRPCTC